MTTDVFADIERFHTDCEQERDGDTYEMYLGLITEEYDELQEAIARADEVEQLDALIDILVVTLGALRAGGFHGEAAWKEVMSTNFAKIDPETGKVLRREDGKILKPDGWIPPNLVPFV